MNAGANIDLNVATAPLANLLVFFGFITFIFLVVIFVIVKYVKKIGTVELDRDSTEGHVYKLNKDISEIDEQMRMQVRTITSSLKTRLRNIFFDAKMCPVTVMALTNSALEPLYDSAENNHFTTVMLPENREDYLNKLLLAIEDEYRSTYNALQNFECGSKLGVMPNWEGGGEISPKERLQHFLDDWVYSVITETIKSCTKKIDIYTSYESVFKGNKYRTDILKACIEKNEKYLVFLDRRGSRRT